MTTGNQLEKNIKILQQYVNDSIDKKYQTYSYSYSVKYSYLTEEQKKPVTEIQIEEFSNKLMLFVRDNSLLKQIIHEIESSHFLWEGSFIECLSHEEKRKYAEFDSSSFKVLEFIKNPSLYDDELPHLSQIIDCVVCIRYLKYLKKLIKPEKSESYKDSSFIKPQHKEDYKVKEENKEQNFGANFEDWQIEILKQCVNETRIFSKPITTETMNDIFSCSLKFPLIVANGKNKLLAYFFISLDDRSLIVKNWQSLCTRKRLFQSYKHTPLVQNHFSSAVNQCRENPPKDCHIIDKYIKQLKKD